MVRTFAAPRVSVVVNAQSADAAFVSAPAITGAAATTVSGSAAGYREWTVTAQVAAMYTGGNHGFLIRDATEDSGGNEHGFHAREKAPDQPPQLVITFD